jgi:hypothetical protein
VQGIIPFIKERIMSITISEQTVYNLLLKALDNKALKKDLLTKAIITMAGGGYKLEYLLHLLYATDAVLLYPGDYFKTTPDKYHLGKEFNYDDLIDLGLLSDDHMVYGQIIRDDGWSSEYDPFYGRVKVNMLYYNNNKKLLKKETSINTAGLIKINQKDILYFKNLNNGKNNKTTSENGDQKLEECQETI